LRRVLVNQEKKADVASIPTAFRIERAMMKVSGLYGSSMRSGSPDRLYKQPK